MTWVPIFSDISFYSDQESQKARFLNVKSLFFKKYGHDSEFIARAPGRVNLLGEHIDYCHFSVLPMAIEVDVIAAFASSQNSSFKISNTDPKFLDETFELTRDGSLLKINTSKPTWGDYFKCGVIVAQKYITEKYPNLLNDGKKPLMGLNAVFDGTVPTGGGLSSSAAFCICATLAVLRVNGVTRITKQDLTQITVVSEHYVGLNNGGMDQCASVNGEPNKVLLILFKPNLKSTPFELPKTQPETIFLVTNSLITANKTETSPTNYNLRVVEVAIAADLIARRLDLKVEQDSNLSTATLRGSFDACFSQKMQKSDWDGQNINVGISRLLEMLEIIETLYSSREKSGFTTDEAIKALGVSPEFFRSRYLGQFPVRYEKLNLYRRSRHVYGESLRVLRAISLARTFNGDSETYLIELGKLMKESQDSTRDLNQASAPGCDRLCEIGVKNGSYGSRVTGAGFGGSVVHLTTVDRLQGLIESLKRDYYEKEYPELPKVIINTAFVISKPSQGACLVELK